jgi:transposase
LSDITGVTGMKIVRAIVAGERDTAVLAEFRDVRCKATVATIREVLSGNFRAEHVFALQQALELYDIYQKKIRVCDTKIEEALQALHKERVAPPSCADPWAESFERRHGALQYRRPPRAARPAGQAR